VFPGTYTSYVSAFENVHPKDKDGGEFNLLTEKKLRVIKV
jgi:hypothetical protein